MFTLHKQQAKIAGYNPRAEKHGEKNVPAGDVKFEVSAHASALTAFGPDYVPFLFRLADAPNDQPSLVPGDNLTELAKPLLKPLRLDEDFPGYRLVIENGLASGKPLILTEAELSGFAFEAKQGGTVTITFSATVHPDAKEAGKLCDLIQDTVELTLEPPLADAQSAQINAFADAETGDEEARRAAHPAEAHAIN
jgi:hypothetical protein